MIRGISYDNAGHTTGYVPYGDQYTGDPFSYTLDAMGRPTALTETNTGTVWVQNVVYGPGGEMDSMQYRTGTNGGGPYYTENRGYNNDTQLTACARISYSAQRTFGLCASALAKNDPAVLG